MRLLVVAVLTPLLLLATAGAASAVSFALNPTGCSSHLAVGASDGLGGPGEQFDPVALPFTDSHAVVDGGSSSAAVYDLSSNSFDVAFDHTRATAPFSHAGSTGVLCFTVDAIAIYTLAGTYATRDPVGSTVVQHAWLADTTIDETLFDQWQGSESVPDESLTLGMDDGQWSDLRGSTMGLLTPGHTYEVYYRLTMDCSPDACASPATATGYFHFGVVPLVPEPSTASLLGLGLVGISAVRRRRSSG